MELCHYPSIGVYPFSTLTACGAELDIVWFTTDTEQVTCPGCVDAILAHLGDQLELALER